MNLAVTGATSFLGAALIRELLKTGNQVYAVVRPGSRNRQVLTEFEKYSGFHIIFRNLDELDQLNRDIPVPCLVYFHFGWDGSGSENRKNPQVQGKNAEDGMKALEGARKLGCKRFLFSGSQAEYGICGERMVETQVCHPVSEYGKAKVSFGKRAADQVRKWHRAGVCSMEYVHTRIFSVYGPGDHEWSLVNTCLERFLHGQDMELGACTQQWNFLYIEDLVKGLLALAFCELPVGAGADPEENGIYNLAGGEDATRPLRNYVEEMKKLCGGQGTCHYGKRLPNAEGQANLIPDIRKIEEKTGWKPEISFEEGIKRMIEQRECRCIVCGAKLGAAPLMELESMPASAQNIPLKEEEAEKEAVSLRLFQCENCGLVQFDCKPVDYYRDVIRSGGYSTTMVELRTRQYCHLIDTYHLEGKKFLEAGCGRGEFLKVLTKFPVKGYGIEHRADLVEIARADGLEVVQDFPETKDHVLGSGAPYDVFLSFNFLEHQPEPGVMLDCIAENLTEDGMGLITVPSLEYILEHDGYYELIRDHIAYYTFETLRYLLESHGFEVLEEEMVNRDTLSVIVRRAKTAAPCIHFKKVDVTGLRRSRQSIDDQLERLVDSLKKEGKKMAVWGASHQGFTLTATTHLKGFVSYIIDSAPFKQGRFAPASGLAIVPPDYVTEHKVDAILIVAPGYTEEIARNIRERWGEQIQILTLRSEKVEELS